MDWQFDGCMALAMDDTADDAVCRRSVGAGVFGRWTGAGGGEFPGG